MNSSVGSYRRVFGLVRHSLATCRSVLNMRVKLEGSVNPIRVRSMRSGWPERPTRRCRCGQRSRRCFSDPVGQGDPAGAENVVEVTLEM